MLAASEIFDGARTTGSGRMGGSIVDQGLCECIDRVANSVENCLVGDLSLTRGFSLLLDGLDVAFLRLRELLPQYSDDDPEHYQSTEK